MDMPLSMNVGVPDDPRDIDKYDEYGEFVDWFLVLEFNTRGSRNYVSLSHAEGEKEVVLAKIWDDDNAIANEAIDFNDDDPGAFADRLLNRLYASAKKTPPEHGIVAFRDSVAKWAARWRERAAERAEESSAN
jgi:hypothetical protein